MPFFFGRAAFWVVDPGTPYDDQQKLLRDYVETRQQRGGKFLGVCLTHHHGDHSRAAEFLATQFSVPIVAHRNAREFLKFSFHPLADQDNISHAPEPRLVALYTPGHAEDHVAYFADELGILIAGDMITDRGTILIPPESGSLSVYLASLERLSRLNLSAIIPAHGQPIVDAPNQFLIKAMKHRYERIHAVFATIKNQDAILDATDITRLVYRDSIPENLMIFAQLSVESSLQWLKEAQLVVNPHHAWRVASDAQNFEATVLLDCLEEIDQRLRNT